MIRSRFFSSHIGLAQFFAGIVVGCLILSSELIAAAELDAVVARLNAPLSQGVFQQKKYLAGLPLPLESSGYFDVQATSLLWQTEQPFHSVLEINQTGITQREGGEVVWQINAAEQPLVATLGQLLIGLLAGEMNTISTLFNVDSVELLDDGCWRTQLRVRDSTLAQFMGAVSAQGCATINQIDLVEINGDRTEIRLSPRP